MGKGMQHFPIAHSKKVDLMHVFKFSIELGLKKQLNPPSDFVKSLLLFCFPFFCCKVPQSVYTERGISICND